MSSSVSSPSPISTSRPFVLHVSGDFPDPIEPLKTRVVQTLVKLTKDRFEHEVVSINRASPSHLGTLAKIASAGTLAVHSQEFEHGTALTYEAPSKGVRHRTSLVQLGDWLTQCIKVMPRQPDLIVGHKLAIEGIAVRRAAEALNIPYGLSIQGDSDTKIMGVRRDLNDEFRQILHASRITFPFTPWAWDFVTQRLGDPPGPHMMLPCPTDLDEPQEPRPGGKGLISVFHLKNYKRKNLAALAEASKRLQKAGINVPLAILGGGDSAQRTACEAIISGVSSISLDGSHDRAEVRARMNAATAFVLPSLRESFGLVFIEALFAGLPIIYPRGTAVDGYFDGLPFALPIDARDPTTLAEAIKRAVEGEAELKAQLAKWQRSDAAKTFQRPAIAETFTKGLTLAIGG